MILPYMRMNRATRATLRRCLRHIAQQPIINMPPLLLMRRRLFYAMPIPRQSASRLLLLMLASSSGHVASVDIDTMPLHGTRSSPVTCHHYVTPRATRVLPNINITLRRITTRIMLSILPTLQRCRHTTMSYQPRRLMPTRRFDIRRLALVSITCVRRVNAYVVVFTPPRYYAIIITLLLRAIATSMIPTEL